MSSSVSASVSRCKGLSLAPRAVAFPRARGVIVRAEGEASAAATATAPPVEPEVVRLTSNTFLYVFCYVTVRYLLRLSVKLCWIPTIVRVHCACSSLC